MKTIVSEERDTDMGGTHFTAVLLNGKWERVSLMKGIRRLGKDCGWYAYAVDVADDVISARFDRSNSGNELVYASNGMTWRSFEAADRWASGESAPTTCLHCGRPM